MFQPINKVAAEITGKVINFKESKSYNPEKNSTNIILLCDSTLLNKVIECEFNYSSKWQKLNLRKGDTVVFQATIKTTSYFAHITEDWIDDWGTLPPNLSKEVTEIEIKSPYKIFKKF